MKEALIILLLFALLAQQAYAKNAQENYRMYCSQCHGEVGNLTPKKPIGIFHVPPRNFNIPGEQDQYGRTLISYSNDILETKIKRGQPKENMPAFCNEFTENEMQELINYIKNMPDFDKNKTTVQAKK